MSAVPAFRLFPDPLRESVFERSDEPCVVCGQRRGWAYTCGCYGDDEQVNEGPLCPWCIADGSAALRGASFHCDFVSAATGDLLRKSRVGDADQVIHRTPGFTTWQGGNWMVCCDKACVYLGEARQGDLTGRWADAVPSMFVGSDWSDDEIAEFAREIGEDGVSPAAYVFQCQVCRNLCGFWDCD